MRRRAGARLGGLLLARACLLPVTDFGTEARHGRHGADDVAGNWNVMHEYYARGAR